MNCNLEKMGFCHECDICTHDEESVRRSYELEQKCSVKDLEGNHCPEKVVTYIDRDGKKLPLCRKCYNNVMKGSYGC